MNLIEALESGVAILKRAGVEAPAADAGVLLCSAAGCDRTYLYAHGDRAMEPYAARRYGEYLDSRSRGTPVQYITGRCEFMSLEFSVGPEVLIPRQDTEVLVETAAALLLKAGRPPDVLDVGAGSGCIAVSIAHIVKACRVTAVDISAAALGVAGRNALKNGVAQRLEFIRSDLFESLGGRKFDAILSNPPYIRSGDIRELQREVRDFEPRGALDGGPDGLAFYRRIIGDSPAYMNAGGLLLFEVGRGQAADVAAMMERAYTDIKTVRDLAGIERVVKGELKDI